MHIQLIRSLEAKHKYSELNQGEALERIARQKVKFVMESVRYKSYKVYIIINGPAGI